MGDDRFQYGGGFCREASMMATAFCSLLAYGGDWNSELLMVDISTAVNSRRGRFL